MAAPALSVFVTLKLHLLRAALRRSAWQVVGLAVGALYALGLGALGVAGLVALRWASPADAAAATAVGGALLLLGWAVVPLLAFGADATLDPARLALFAVPRRRLVAGLLAAGLVGLPGLVTALLALAAVVTWSRGVLPVVVALVCAPLAATTCVAASRASTTALARVLAGRRGRELVGVLGIVLAICVGPVISLATSGLDGADADGLRRAAAAVGWSPLGWVWTAPAEAAAGRPLAALAKTALAALLLVALLGVWSAALRRALEAGPGRSGGRGGARGPSSGRAGPVVRALGALEARGRTGAVAARCLRGWRRDTRYAVSLVGVLALPVVLVVLTTTTPVPGGVAALGTPLVLGAVLGWTVHDDTAYDGTALWLHLASGLPGRSDRAGRALGLLLWAVPLVVVTAVAGVAVDGRWWLLPAVLGAALALLGSGAGVSSVSSAVVVYPVPEPGASPFSSPQGATAVALLVQGVTSLASGLLALPAVALLVAAVLVGGGDAGGPALLLALGGLLVGAATGVLAVREGVRRGGTLLDARGPELLARLAR